MPDRRTFLRRALGLATAGFLAPRTTLAAARPKFASYPFTLGVASGSPTATGFVLWTRLAPEPLAGGGLGPEGIELRWEIAHDEKFARIARRGTITADAGRAHAVHVEAEGLDPARWYFYRFIAGGEASATGRARTAPGAGAGEERLKLALASCQHYEQGYFVAHRHLAAEQPDLVAFVGDYIYERSRKGGRVREHRTPDPHDLAGYRDRLAQYKTDPDLQAAHACAPWILTWDDHEVDNDYAADQGQDLDPAFVARRTAAYRAYFEHLPLRPSVLRDGGEVRLYGTLPWGDLATLHVLDDRQYRAPQACPRPGRGGSNTVGPWCEERLAAGRTLLGAAQERWLAASLAASKARWNFLVQQTLMAPAGRLTDNGPQNWTDGWDGYPWARAQLLEALVRTKVANPVVLGGDVHANYVADLRADPADPSSPVVATEFCGTSITSEGLGPKFIASVRAANPHIHYADASRRGYVLFDAGRERLEARLRVVDSIKQPDAGVATAAAYVVTAGTPGVAGPA